MVLETELLSPLEVRKQNTVGLKRGNRVNLTGRPKSVREKVLALTNDGNDIVREFQKIGFDSKEKTGDRLDALQWLSDHGFGKCVNTVEISGKDGGKIEIEHCSADDLRSELLKIGAIDVGGRLVIGNWI